MVFGSEGFTFSKAFIIPTSIVIGSGAAYFAYQFYVSSQRCRLLNMQMSILTQRIIYLEAEVSQLRSDLEHSGSSSDDEFLDATEVVDTSQIARDRVPNDLDGNRPKRESKGKDALLTSLDEKVEKGGLKNLSMVYDHLTQLIITHPNDCDVFWRLARAAFLLASEEMMENPNTSQERQNELKLRAKTAADNAVKCNDECAEAHKWMAIILGSVTKDLPAKNQLENAFLIRNHIDCAIEKNPDDSIMHHIKGRWCYSVYMMTWIERKVATALFGNPPTSTLEEATSCFEKAEELLPRSSVDNLLYLGKVYIAGKEYTKAMLCLLDGEKMTCSQPDDIRSIEEIKQLIKQYKKYSPDSL